MRSVPAAIAACCLSLALSGCKARQPEPPPEQAAVPVSPPPAPAAPAPGDDRARVAAVADRPVILAELPANDAGHADRKYLFAERGGGVAWVAEEGGKSRVFHNGRAGEAYEEVGTVALSPDGAHVAHEARTAEGWRLVVDGKPGPAGAARLRIIEFSGDASRIVLVEVPGGQDWGVLAVTDLAQRTRTVVDPRAGRVVLNADRSRLAAVTASDDGQRLLAAALDAPGQARRSPRWDGIQAVTFAPDGVLPAYVAQRDGATYAVLGERERRIPDGEQLLEVPAVRPGGGEMAGVVVVDGSVFLRRLFGAAAREGPYGGVNDPAWAPDGGSLAFAAERGQSQFIVSNGKEGPPFDRVVGPLFSPDGKRLVYRAREDGKRFVVIADANARTLRRLPAYEQVFPPRFTADGKSVAYGVKDGRALAWKVEPL
jgi:hypothetical protein